jgi:hypothetical protein
MDEISLTLPDFWTWLMSHPNCILRAGTPEATLFDDESLHWMFAYEEPETLIIQAFRGKQLAGEVLITPEQITSVRGFDGDVEGEYVFELVTDGEPEPFAAVYLVMAHGLDEDDPADAVH